MSTAKTVTFSFATRETTERLNLYGKKLLRHINDKINKTKFVYLNSFVQLSPWTNFVGGAFEVLSASAKI